MSLLNTPQTVKYGHRSYQCHFGIAGPNFAKVLESKVEEAFAAPISSERQPNEKT